MMQSIIVNKKVFTLIIATGILVSWIYSIGYSQMDVMQIRGRDTTFCTMDS